jgi:hypothetical protein
VPDEVVSSIISRVQRDDALFEAESAQTSKAAALSLVLVPLKCEKM